MFSLIGNQYYDRAQSELLFRRYDQDSDQKIDFREFCRIIVPVDLNAAKRLVARKPEVEISHQTQDLVRQLLKTILSNEAAHEYLRQRL